MATLIYTLSDFDNIKWACHEPFTLPEETIKMIELLTQQVGSPTYVKTPLFVNNKHGNNNGGNNNGGTNSDNGNNRHHRKKRRDYEEIKLDDWTALRNFQKTEFVSKEGIEKEIDGIRLLINKMTEKTYDKISEKLFETLDRLEENENDDTTYINKIGHFIFTTATSNKFNSHIYATLASELKARYTFMTNIIVDNITEFMKLFENMEFVSPDENYDKFCEMNIVNEKRRAMSLFLTSLYHTNVITLEFVFDNIQKIQNMLVDDSRMKDDSKRLENEELVENLYILLTNISVPTLKTHDQWNTVYENLIKVKSVDTKVFVGITPKNKFKHMDILDILNKLSKK